MLPNLIRLVPAFPGQMGVFGSDVPLGVRTTPRGITLYVDAGHPDASDSNDGTDPVHPLATIQAAVGKLQGVGDQIMVAQGIYTGATIPATAPRGCYLIAQADKPHSVILTGGDDPALVVEAAMWTFSGLTFICPPEDEASAVVLAGGASPYTGAADGSRFERCHFAGGGDAQQGVDLHGAPSGVQFVACSFTNIYNVAGDATAVGSSDQSEADPSVVLFEGCLFGENDIGIDLPSDFALIRDCYFMPDGGQAVPVKNIDLAGGSGANMVVGCYLPGDYSTPGLYRGGTGDFWTGNFADDVAEAEVGDNGITLAPPAA